jgi:DNA-binding transcriptional MerR regulator
MDKTQGPLPEIPAKRYFTIGEVGELCGVKPYVLRYWEQEFTQLRPVKRRGNRRYYQHHEVLLIRRIRDLLYEQGFTISGARNRLAAGGAVAGEAAASSTGATADRLPAGAGATASAASMLAVAVAHAAAASPPSASVPLEHLPGLTDSAPWSEGLLRRELLSIRQLLEV